MAGYLERYAEGEARLPLDLRERYEHVLVIPCFDEAPDCIADAVAALDARVLVVAVVNTPAHATEEQLLRTRDHWNHLTGASSEPVTVTRLNDNVDVLAVDRMLPDRAIPRRQGVGLARKIGADVALACIRRGDVASAWIHQTDGDARLPADYFLTPDLDLTPGVEPAGVLIYPFRHHPADEPRIARYELQLEYYVDRLRFAGSPYAFHTVGSTIAIRADVYEAVRGVPKRNAAEDFYLLNKAAKVAAVRMPETQPIVLAARVSRRVPFGTGAALAAMDLESTHLSYAPQSFELLREALAYIDALGEGPLTGETQALLEESGLIGFLPAARRQYKRPETLRRALHHRFDAFRTLRFVHEARRYHPDAPLNATLDALFGPGDHRATLRARANQAPRQLGVS